MMILKKAQLDKVLEAFANLKARAARDIIQAQETQKRHEAEQKAKAAQAQ